MKNAWLKLVEIIKNKDYTVREAVLSSMVLFLLGVVVGVFFSPKKHTMIGSNNGSNNAGFTFPTDDEEEESEE